MRFSSVLFVLLFTGCCEAVCQLLNHNKTNTVKCSPSDLKYIPNNSWNSTDVHGLDLSHNHIEELNGLADWRNISTLDLSYNLLIRVTDDDFTDFDNLIELNLCHNNFIELAIFKWTDSLPSLKILDLSKNLNLGKSTLLVKALSALKISNVQHLNLSSINWSYPPLDIFKSHSSLIKLDLSANCMRVLPVLPGNLQYVDLSHNCFHYIGPYTFEKDTRLQTLLLGSNIYLNMVNIESFYALALLKTVSFDHCSNLAQLPSTLFNHNAKLRYVSLRGCNLTTLAGNFRKRFMKLKYIDLRNNPWHCDYQIKWFGDMAKAGILNMSSDLRCSSPFDGSMEEWLDKRLNRTIRIVVTASCVILAAALVATVAFSCRMEAKRHKTLAASYKPLGREKNPPHSQDVHMTTAL